MAYKVTLSRVRRIKEKAVQIVQASNPMDAIAVMELLERSDKVDWKYNRNLETSPTEAQAVEVKSNEENAMGGEVEQVKSTNETPSTPATDNVPATDTAPKPAADQPSTENM